VTAVLPTLRPSYRRLVAEPGSSAEERAPGWHERGSDEFSRVLAFSDGLFAIAMTLLVVSIAVPRLHDATDERELARSLQELSPSFVSFAISFVVIGRYWLAHHQFFALLRAIDSRLILINLIYLAFIAFLPFPTDLLGTYFHNPLSVAFYAAAVGAVSGLEVVMFRHARLGGLLRKPMPQPIYRWGVIASVLPVVFFVLSAPVAFLSVQLAVAMWVLAIPAELVTGRFKPEGADSYLS
jgi:uncharacterized membrane protein